MADEQNPNTPAATTESVDEDASATSSAELTALSDEPVETAARTSEDINHELPPHPGEEADRADVHAWIREKVARFSRSAGVYLMKDAQDRVLYVGKARRLRERVASYFQKSADLTKSRGPHIARMVDEKVHDVDFLECENEVDALLTENRLVKDIQPPFNEQLRDDKTFPYIMITTGEDFPGVYVTREPRKGRGVRLFGPFTSAGLLRDAVTALQKVYKFRTCELDIREDDEKRKYFRPCLLHAINQCTAPCAALITKEDYAKDMADFVRFMKSKRRHEAARLTREMNAASKSLDFETAAKLRDRIKAIKALSLTGASESFDEQPEVFYQDPSRGVAKLAEVLNLDEPPRIIEGIDIAHLHGNEMVGALVCFIDGRPHKPGYKRFRIKTVEGVDDFASIREVVARRYRYAAVEQEIYPDLILIDGGKGQLTAAMEAFEQMRDLLATENIDMIQPPTVISLAKQDEEIFCVGRNESIRLTRNNPALKVLQHVRDESHRFGQHYHHLLRSKKLFEDDVKQGKRPPRQKRKKKS